MKRILFTAIAVLGIIGTADADNLPLHSGRTGGYANTDGLAEGSTNQYFTNERVDDRVDTLIQDSGGVAWTYDDSGGTLTADLVMTSTAKTADYTWALTDKTDYLRFSSSGNLTATIPPNSSVAFPIGTQLLWSMLGGGSLTIAPGSGVTINTVGGGLNYSNAAGSAIKVDTNTWDVIGGAE